ncbi:MAG: alpha/beta fold hydrolase [Candidatus Hydrogenedentes bacterium]|nr:alpha/beta fold hydrolase [Candidatus Hydrogenedentota bacterium]
MNDSRTYNYERIPFPILFQETADFEDTYGGTMGYVFFDAHLLKPKERESKTVIVFSHPIGGGAWLPLVNALARAGHHVIYTNGRYRGNDTALIMEKCVVDLGACIRHAKEKLGYERIILGGWSGGGSLSLFYQEQAEQPSLTSTPAGDPPDLTQAGLIPADGVMLLAAHVSRATTLTEWMDPSILDESNPDLREPELNLYDPDNPNQPPYSEDYLARYRETQIARNRRITAWVKERLDMLRAQGKTHHETGFVVQGTMADPRWLDPAVDPNQRKPGTCYLGDPKVVNDGPVGLARFCTLRSWLSQWSYDDSKADGVRCANRITVPVLVIGNLADDACTPSHTHRLYDAVSHADKEIHEIDGASHYYLNQPEQQAQAVGHCGDWIQKHGWSV